MQFTRARCWEKGRINGVIQKCVYLENVRVVEIYISVLRPTRLFNFIILVTKFPVKNISVYTKIFEYCPLFSQKYASSFVTEVLLKIHFLGLRLNRCPGCL